MAKSDCGRSIPLIPRLLSEGTSMDFGASGNFAVGTRGDHFLLLYGFGSWSLLLVK